MAFTYLAFAYVVALLFTAVLIFFAIWHVRQHLFSRNVNKLLFYI